MKKVRKASKRIKQLREARGQTQLEFAKSLEVTQPMISAWEGGRDEPSPEAYVHLGNLAPYPDNIWFWRQAGMDQEALVSGAGKLLKERGAPALEGEIIRVPCIRKSARGTEDRGDVCRLPAECVPNPGSTVAFLIFDEVVASPMLHAQDFIIVDTSEINAKDLWPFYGKVVLIEVDLSVDRPIDAYLDAVMGHRRLCMGRLGFDVSKTFEFRASAAGHSEFWIATVDPFCDRYKPWRALDEPISIGHWQATPPKPLVSKEEVEDWQEENAKQGPSKIRLEDSVKILGCVVGIWPY